MKYLPILLLAACSVAPTELPHQGDAPQAGQRVVYSSEAYQSCAACHLADGAGVPGAFPPLRGRAAAMAEQDGGREYLIAVVSHGLMGAIEAGGMEYFGVMPGNQGFMSDADIAAALNYLVFELVDDADRPLTLGAFTASEIESANAAVATASPTVAQRMRTQLVKRHGEQWPR